MEDAEEFTLQDHLDALGFEHMERIHVDFRRDLLDEDVELIEKVGLSCYFHIFAMGLGEITYVVDDYGDVWVCEEYIDLKYLGLTELTRNEENFLEAPTRH